MWDKMREKPRKHGKFDSIWLGLTKLKTSIDQFFSTSMTWMEKSCSHLWMGKFKNFIIPFDIIAHVLFWSCFWHTVLDLMSIVIIILLIICGSREKVLAYPATCYRLFQGELYQVLQILEFSCTPFLRAHVPIWNQLLPLIFYEACSNLKTLARQVAFKYLISRFTIFLCGCQLFTMDYYLFDIFITLVRGLQVDIDRAFDRLGASCLHALS